MSDLEKLMKKLKKDDPKTEDPKAEEPTPTPVVAPTPPKPTPAIDEDDDEDDEDDVLDEEGNDVTEEAKEYEEEATPQETDPVDPIPAKVGGNLIEEEVEVLQNNGIFRRELLLVLKEGVDVQKVNAQILLDIKSKLMGDDDGKKD